MFNFARLFSFATLGFLLGLIGSFFRISIRLTAILSLFVAFIMIVLGAQMAGIEFFNKVKLTLPKSFSLKIVNE